MEIKILLILIIGVKLNECIDPKEFCINKEKEFQCKGEYSLNCGGVLCTKNEDSCHSLAVFSSLNKNCVNKINWLNLLKYDKCGKCSGKYSLRCNSDYCGLDKRACNGLKKNSIDLEIKKCDNF